MKFGIKVRVPFTDGNTGEFYRLNSTIEIDSESRAHDIFTRGLGELAYVIRDDKKGPRILIYQMAPYKIGGIETAHKQISAAFPQKNITFVVGKGDPTHLLELAKNHSVIIDEPGKTYETDVLILSNTNTLDVVRRVKARKIYQFVHMDFDGFKKVVGQYNLSASDKIDKYIAVSETAREGFKRAFGKDAIVCSNILNPIKKEDRKMVFVVLSRATKEKGIDRILEFTKWLDGAGKDYVVFLCSTIDQLDKPTQDAIRASRKIVVVPPTAYSRELLRAADYLVQLSSVEAYCYSVREALQRKVPVIVSDIPEFRKIVKDGENGYLLNGDLSNIDVERIFNEIPKPKAYSEKIDPNWEKILNGEV